MKKYILMTIACFICLSGFFLFKQYQSKPTYHLKEIEETLSTYEISGTMELMDEDAIRKVKVMSLYKKIDDVDCFYVRLEDESTHQVQSIVKNKEGVFVQAPGFSRAFSFKTDWPNNGFKPYILHNILDVLEKDREETKIKDGYIYKATIEDPTHPNACSALFLLDQYANFQEIHLVDENENNLLSFQITTYKINPEIDEQLFTVSNEKQEVSIQDDLPLYPLQVFENELIDQLKTNEGLLLRYKGETYFTLYQTKVDEVNGVIEGDCYLFENGLLYQTNNESVLIKDGIKTTIYSKGLSLNQQRDVLLSLENNVVIVE